jgi:RNA polymerase sigma-70 factor (ECF subfamily)
MAYVAAHETPALAGARDHLADEAFILAQARTDPAAFAPLYERYVARIYQYCRRRVGHPEEAEDLTSLVFSRALGGLASYRGGSPAAWLFAIAHNAVANHLRDRRPHLSLDSSVPSLIYSHPEPSPDPLDLVLRDEERRRVAKLVAELTEEQRALLALKVVGQLSAKEMGAVLGKREGAVRVALYRVVQQLRRAYQRNGLERGA